jgi:hypothetical protein
MKTEIEIRKMLRRLDDMDENFSDNLDTYTSIIYEDEDGKPEVLDGDEASSILGNVQIAQYVLEWVIEDGDSLLVKPVESENEALLNRGKILVDGNGKEYVKDWSADAFIARMENQV